MKKINTKKTCAVFFCLICLCSAYAQTTQSEVHYDVEIVVTGIQEHSEHNLDKNGYFEISYTVMFCRTRLSSR